MPALPQIKLTLAHKRELLAVARDTLNQAFIAPNAKMKPAQLSDSINQLKLGCFVTLTLDGELKGCIGCIVPDRPLAELIPAMTKSSAFNDHRFPPLAKSQLAALCIEISLLSEMKQIKVGDQKQLQSYLKDEPLGLVLSEAERSAVFLPQVWQQLSTPKEFIEALKVKGGWSRDYWSADMKVEVFSVTHFSEQQL